MLVDVNCFEKMKMRFLLLSHENDEDTSCCFRSIQRFNDCNFICNIVSYDSREGHSHQTMGKYIFVYSVFDGKVKTVKPEGFKLPSGQVLEKLKDVAIVCEEIENLGYTLIPSTRVGNSHSICLIFRKPNPGESS